MTDFMWKVLILLVWFILWVMAVSGANLKKRRRGRQFLLPLAALIYALVSVFRMDSYRETVQAILLQLPVWLEQLALWLQNNITNEIGFRLAGLVNSLIGWLKSLELNYWLYLVVNVLMMLDLMIFKRLAAMVLGAFRYGEVIHQLCISPIYDYDDEFNAYHLKEGVGQARRLALVGYAAVCVMSLALFLVTEKLYLDEVLLTPFYPILGAFVIGEIYHFINGFTWDEDADHDKSEDDVSSTVVNYALLREFLKKHFGDKLNAEDTTTNYDLSASASGEDLLSELQQADTAAEEAYGIFMEKIAGEGFALDQNYLVSGRDLLRGKSILFNDPFQADLIPYAFYPLNRTLLRGKKVLVVLGRHGAEEETANWCAEGIGAVTGIPTLWNIGVLQNAETQPDIGILTRSAVHDLALHAGCEDFFAQVEYLVLLEPSRLVTTAQIGLNSIVKRCKGAGEKPIVCCSVDHNCDGLVDALSHILMTNITEVAPTGHYTGASSYMCWDATSEHLQHRMLPNIARYLGTGTELAFAALKNQVSRAVWYGGDAFPVRDMRWISSQYYHELLEYAGLPANQRTFEDRFDVSSSMWSAPRSSNAYLVVEDEINNMFEMRRTFATRAKEQGFVNIISADYMLKDYMAANEQIFRTDPKAIPSIVADYARTRRNVVLRLLLMMSAGRVTEAELCKELMLLDIDTADPRESFWAELCACCSPLGEIPLNELGEPVLLRTVHGKQRAFTQQVLQVRRRYNAATGLVEPQYSLEDKDFITSLLYELQSAGYLAEDEQGNRHFLGSELRSHVFQRYLPGQLFTFDGKYYEMLSLASDGHVIVRRAADHIHGRPFYRQIRQYTVSAAKTADEIAATQNIAGLRITRQYADFTVDTPAYWRMESLQDFAHAKRVEVSGIPQRSYVRKRILRLELPGASARITATVTMLFNEVFRTLYAQDHPYLVAVTGDTADVPQLTCTLQGGQSGCIYILEDSTLDLGLLISAERNLERIFRIVCDYLDWHMQALELSKNPPAPPAPPVMPEEPKPAKKQNIFAAVWNGIKKAASGLWGWLRKLFGKKPKQAEEPADGVSAPTEETPEEAVPGAGAAPAAPETGEAAAPVAEQAAPAPAESDAAEVKSGSRASRRRKSGLASRSAAPAGEEDAPAFDCKQPYHTRYFLLFGDESEPAAFDYAGTLAYLQQLGFGDSDLARARRNGDIAQRIARSYKPGRPGVHYCDFCGVELAGTEYEVLADGRERCTVCGRSAVRTEEEFNRLYGIVQQNMAAFFGIRITVPVKITMTNSKTLHRRLGDAFVATPGYDGRVLGVAIRDKRKDSYTIYLENGAPRMMSVMTMAHELTHIWQYVNWKDRQIVARYGADKRLEIYEGMAKWVEIQYAALVGETAAAKREELLSLTRNDEYGRGFIRYLQQYPLNYHGQPARTPFQADPPLE